MRHAKLFCSILAAGMLTMVAMWVLSLKTPAPSGDLVRIGYLASTMFAPTRVQAPLDPVLLRDAGWRDADVLVIGDSFSLERQWQSRLVASGLRVTTIAFPQTVGLCAELPQWVRAQGFRGHTVVIETVERNVEGLFEHWPKCDTPRWLRPGHRHDETGLPIAGAAAPAAALPAVSLTAGLQTAWNTTRVLRDPKERQLEPWGGGARVRVRPFAEGCRRFSHRACDIGLFLWDDLARPPVSATSMARIAEVHALPRDFELVWLVVPDKSTYYLEPQRFEAVAAALESRGLGPDMLRTLKMHAASDTYRPDDTHLSNEAYGLMGERMLRWFGEMKGDPRPASVARR